MESIKLGTSSAPWKVPTSLSNSKSEPEVYYPGMCLPDVDTSDWPDEGEMTVKYRLRRRTEDLKKEEYSADLDIVEILDVSGKSDDKPEYGTGSDREKAFEDAARAVLEKTKK